jgi:hypothetical protein
MLSRTLLQSAFGAPRGAVKGARSEQCEPREPREKLSWNANVCGEFVFLETSDGTWLFDSS